MRLPSAFPTALLLVAALAAPAAPARADGPALVVQPDTLRTDVAGTWNATLDFRNPLTSGLYPDSLCVDEQDRDPGESGEPRGTSQRLDGLLRAMGTIAAGGGAQLGWNAAAPFERGQVVFRAYFHDAHGQSYSLRRDLVADGGALTDSLPSTFVTAAGRRIEVVLAAPRNAAGPAPGLLIVHGPGRHARRLLATAWTLAGRGWAVALVSQPGYGQSQGPPDGAGPATVAALGAALDRLAATPGVDRSRLGVWGVGSGGTAALSLAATRDDIRAVVAQAAGYDLWAAYRAASTAERRTIAAEAGPDSAAWRARSPLLFATRIHSAIMVLSGERDPGPVSAARAFVAARQQAGVHVDARFTPGGFALSRLETTRPAVEFLAREFGP